MDGTAAECVERVTSDLLIGPDWAINLELCDIINSDPRQAKGAIKMLRKRLANKNPKIQLLALFALEALSKNCSEIVLQQIENDVLNDMIKIVKKKPDANVKEKILSLIDMWQEALVTLDGRYPLYASAYRELKDAGFVFPPRSDYVPFFTPPQTQPVVQSDPSNVPAAAPTAEVSVQHDTSGLSLSEIQSAQVLANVLSEMLAAVDLKDPDALKDEAIVDLLDQCRQYQKRVTHLVNDTAEEEFLLKGLALNDTLQHVFLQYDETEKGVAPSMVKEVKPPSLTVDTDGDNESDDDFVQLAHRHRGPSHATGKQPQANSLVPPPSTKNPVISNTGRIDYLSGDNHRHENLIHEPEAWPSTMLTLTDLQLSPPCFPRPSHINPPHPTSPTPPPPPPPPPPVLDARPAFSRSPPVLDLSSLPPPPSRHDQRQQFFEQKTVSGKACVNGGPGSPPDRLAGRARNLSLGSHAKSEDALFKDLVDLARTKPSSSSARRK